VRIIAITNQKGGSGKTTTAVNLAAALGELGKKVLVVDLDPQASASSWLGIHDGGRGLLDVFTDNGNLSDIICNTDVPGLDLAPSSSWLLGVEKALVGEVGAELVLKKALERLPGEWDFIFIDCPPSLGILSVNALAGSREVIVPVMAHVMALAGLAKLLETVEVIKERLNPVLAVTGILACRVDARTRHALEVLEELRRRFKGTVYKTTIPENVRVAESFSFAKPITQYDSRSSGAEAFRSLARELIRRGK